MIWIPVIIAALAHVGDVSSSTDEIKSEEALMTSLRSIQQKLHEIRGSIIKLTEDWCEAEFSQTEEIGLCHLQECAGYQIYVKHHWTSSMNPILFELRHFRRILLTVNSEKRILSPQLVQQIGDFIKDEENIMDDAKKTAKFILKHGPVQHRVDTSFRSIGGTMQDGNMASTGEKTTRTKHSKIKTAISTKRPLSEVVTSRKFPKFEDNSTRSVDIASSYECTSFGMTLPTNTTEVPLRRALLTTVIDLEDTAFLADSLLTSSNVTDISSLARTSVSIEATKLTLSSRSSRVDSTTPSSRNYLATTTIIKHPSSELPESSRVSAIV